MSPLLNTYKIKLSRGEYCGFISFPNLAVLLPDAVNSFLISRVMIEFCFSAFTCSVTFSFDVNLNVYIMPRRLLLLFYYATQQNVISNKCLMEISSMSFAEVNLNLILIFYF